MVSKNVARGCSVRCGFQTGRCPSRQYESSQHHRAVCLTLLLCAVASLAGSNARNIHYVAEEKVAVPLGAQDWGHGRFVFIPSMFLSNKAHRYAATRRSINRKLGFWGDLSTGSSEKKPLWCVAKYYANPDLIQRSLDWACGKNGKVDCKPIQPKGTCFLPNTLLAHASYAFNIYYQSHGFATSTCDFDGAATLTTEDPSTPQCTYPNSLVTSNFTVYSSSIPMNSCSSQCIGAAVGSVLLSSIFLFPG